MSKQSNFRDNYGTININRNGRPTKNPDESLGPPRTFRFRDSEYHRFDGIDSPNRPTLTGDKNTEGHTGDGSKEKEIQKIQSEFNLNRNEVVQKCVQVGVAVFEYLDWIEHNLDTIQLLAQRYNRKRTPV